MKRFSVGLVLIFYFSTVYCANKIKIVHDTVYAEKHIDEFQNYRLDVIENDYSGLHSLINSTSSEIGNQLSTSQYIIGMYAFWVAVGAILIGIYVSHQTSKTEKNLNEITQIKKEIESIKTSVESSKSAVETLKADVDTKKQEIEQVKESVESSKSAVETLKADVDTKKQEIEQVKESVESSKSTVETLQADVDAKKQEIEHVKASVDSIKTEVEQLNATIEKTALDKIEKIVKTEVEKSIDEKISNDTFSNSIEKKIIDTIVNQHLVALEERINKIEVNPASSVGDNPEEEFFFSNMEEIPDPE